MMGTVLEGLDAETVERMIRQLSHTKENLKVAISRRAVEKTAAAAAAA